MSIFGSKKESPRYLGFAITDTTVTGSIWTLENHRAKLLQTSDPIPWDDSHESGLAEAADVVIEQLGDGADSLDEVVIGLPNTWLEKQKMLSEKRPFIQEMRKQLSLSPLGFVVLQEAVAIYLTDLENKPANCVFIQITEDLLHATVIRQGFAQQTETIQLTDNLQSDVGEMLSRFGETDIPTRFLLYSSDLDQRAIQAFEQDLVALSWDDLPSQRLPSIENLQPEFLINAVCMSGGNELARELTESAMTHGAAPAAAIGGSDEEVDGEEFGFSSISDDPAAPPQVPSDEIAPVISAQPRTTNDFREKISRMFPKSKKTLVFGVIGAIVFLMAGYMGVAYAIYEAHVSVLLKQHQLTTKLQFPVAGDGASTAVGAGAVQPVRSTRFTSEKTETKEIETTGSALVGERAKGQVQIFNATNSEKFFEKGTTIRSPDGKTFQLDDDVSVASSSGSSLLNAQPGSATVNVTAREIGVEHNLPADTEFTIANFDKNTYVARNEKEFSGGTSREIQAVSQQDQDRLRTMLVDELLEEIVQENQMSQEDVLRVQMGEPTVKSESFNAKVGEEVRILRLSLTVELEFLEFQQTDILDAVTIDSLNLNLENSMILDEKTTFISGGLSQASESGQLLLDADFEIVYVDVVLARDIQEQLAGRTSAQADSYLRQNFSIQSHTVRYSPFLIGFLVDQFPRSIDRINVEIRVDQEN